MITEEYECIISDSQNNPLASAILESKPSDAVWNIRILGDDFSTVTEHEILGIVSLSDRVPTVAAEILSFTPPDLIRVSPSTKLDTSVRRDLRISVRFDSFLYSATDRWKGRAPILSLDMSCGGIAFYCNQPLQIGEIAELVIPITTQPLVVKIQVLRFRRTSSSIPLIAAKFCDLIHDEEVVIRQAIFNQQLSSHSAGRRKGSEKVLFSEQP